MDEQRTVVAGRTDGDNDWTVYKDGHQVARVYATHISDPALRWMWVVQVGSVGQGYAPSMAEALEEVRRLKKSGSVGDVVLKVRGLGKKKFGNAYEAILAWGYERVDEGVTQEDFRKFIIDNGLNINEPRGRALFLEFFTPLEEANIPKNVVFRRMNSGALFQLTVDASFRYLELVELKEAREGSRRAMIVAIASLVLAAAVGVVQVNLAFDCTERVHWSEKLVCDLPQVLETG